MYTIWIKYLFVSQSVPNQVDTHFVFVIICINVVPIFKSRLKHHTDQMHKRKKNKNKMTITDFKYYKILSFGTFFHQKLVSATKVKFKSAMNVVSIFVYIMGSSSWLKC